MTQPVSSRRTHRRTAPSARRRDAPLWLRLIKGLGAALLVTVAGVAVFALLMQWLRPSDQMVRIVNQLLKLLSVAAGVYVAVGRGAEGGLLRGALIGFVYMLLGVAVYTLLSGQSASASAYLADLAMGVAAGGIIGMILSNISPK